jgi:hypothetical protein
MERANERKKRSAHSIHFSPCIWQSPQQELLIYNGDRTSISLAGWPLVQHNTNNDVCASAAYSICTAAGRPYSTKEDLHTHTHVCVSILLVFMGHVESKKQSIFPRFSNFFFFFWNWMVVYRPLLHKTPM